MNIQFSLYKNYILIYIKIMMKYFIPLFLIDIFSKLLAEIINPNNGFFILKYNPNMILGLEGNFFLQFILPIILLPTPYLLMKISKIHTPFALSLIYAGMLGNYIGRFSDNGVIDFINLGFAVCNLADMYLWIGILTMNLSIFSVNHQKSPQLNQ